MVRNWLAVTVSALALLYSTWAHADASFPPPPQYAAGVFAALQQPVIGSGSLLAVPSTGNNGVVVTNGSGVPSISGTLPSGQIIPAPTLPTGASFTAGETNTFKWTDPLGNIWFTTEPDVAARTPFRDLVLATKCLSTDGGCGSIVDHIYVSNNELGAISAAVVSAGTGYTTTVITQGNETATGDVVTLNTQAAAFTATIAPSTNCVSGTTCGIMTVAAVSSGTISNSEPLSGVASNTSVVKQLSGTTGGVGTYEVQPSQTVASGTTITADMCSSPIMLSVTASGGNVSAVAPYAFGGYGSCVVAPSGTIAQKSSTASGTGLTVTLMMQMNDPTTQVGYNTVGGSGGAISGGAETFEFSIAASSRNPLFGGMHITLGGNQADALRLSQTGQNDVFFDDNLTLNIAAIESWTGGLSLSAANNQITLPTGNQLRFGSTAYLAQDGSNAGVDVVNGYLFLEGPGTSLYVSNEAQLRGNTTLGSQGAGAISTSATSPFFYASTMAGAPTGIPSLAAAGLSAITIDSTDHKFCWYEQANTAWKCVTGS